MYDSGRIDRYRKLLAQPVAPEQKSGFFVAVLHFFGSSCTISRFRERFRQFRDGYIIVIFSFAPRTTVLRRPHQPFVKVC